MIPEECKTEDERKPYWGLAEKVADTIRRRNIDILLVENKTRGGDLVAEVRRLLEQGECRVILLDPEGNKVARLHAVQPMFSDGLSSPRKGPGRKRSSPKSPSSQKASLPTIPTPHPKPCRGSGSGALLLGVEADQDNLQAATFRSKPQPRYDV